MIDKVEDTPTLNANESFALMENGVFEKTDLYTPGFPNTEEGHAAYMSSYLIESGTLVISEICPAPRSGLREEDGELSDWIELKSNSNAPIALDVFALSDNEDRPIKWVFPEDAVIAPHGRYLVFASGKNRENAGNIPHTNFSLAGEGETVTLSTVQGQLLDRVTYPNMPVDHSFGRNEETGEWEVFECPPRASPTTRWAFTRRTSTCAPSTPKRFISLRG